MKKLLLAFALIGFIATSSYATATIVETSPEIEFCDDDKKCDKKDCKHDKKACKASKESCKKGEKKACCAKASADKKACCSKSASAKASCHGAKKGDAKSSDKAVKEEKKDTK